MSKSVLKWFQIQNMRISSSAVQNIISRCSVSEKILCTKGTNITILECQLSSALIASKTDMTCGNHCIYSKSQKNTVTFQENLCISQQDTGCI